MKKLILLLTIICGVVFVGCSNPNNIKSSKSELSEELDMSFLNRNDIITLPDNFNVATWISITQVINGEYGVFFIKVLDRTIIDYGTIHEKNPIPKNMNYSDFLLAKTDNPIALKTTYPYWCKIDSKVYNENKEKLPLYLFE